ncbi:hypothetical protein HMPREF9719_00150, partial [Corynebacterium otitidis ATCC 51513]
PRAAGPARPRGGRAAAALRRVPRPVRLISPLAVLVIWQLVSQFGLVDEATLPAPSTIVAAGWETLTDGTLVPALTTSGGRVIAGFLLGGIVGIGLGVAVGLSKIADIAIDPIVQEVRSIPHLGLVPLFIIWFGIGELPKVLLIALGVGFPLYLNAASGLRQVDFKLLETGRVLGFSLWQRTRYVVFPSAAPALFVGLRQASAAAWLSLIIAEQINAREGLGFMINNAREFYRTDIVIFGLIVYAAFGLICDWLIRLAERRVFAYRTSERAS